MLNWIRYRYWRAYYGLIEYLQQVRMRYGRNSTHKHLPSMPKEIEGHFEFVDEVLSKREEFASMAMQGLLASGKWTSTDIENSTVAETAIAAADTLIKAIEKFK